MPSSLQDESMVKKVESESCLNVKTTLMFGQRETENDLANIRKDSSVRGDFISNERTLKRDPNQ